MTRPLLGGTRRQAGRRGSGPDNRVACRRPGCDRRCNRSRASRPAADVRSVLSHTLPGPSGLEPAERHPRPAPGATMSRFVRPAAVLLGLAALSTRSAAATPDPLLYVPTSAQLVVK